MNMFSLHKNSVTKVLYSIVINYVSCYNPHGYKNRQMLSGIGRTGNVQKTLFIYLVNYISYYSPHGDKNRQMLSGTYRNHNVQKMNMFFLHKNMATKAVYSILIQLYQLLQSSWLQEQTNVQWHLQNRKCIEDFIYLFAYLMCFPLGQSSKGRQFMDLLTCHSNCTKNNCLSGPNFLIRKNLLLFGQMRCGYQAMPICSNG